MNQTVTGGLGGRIAAIGSKSRAHRLLICAALSSQPCTVRCAARSEDILATVRCLRALGARIDDTGEGFAVTPLRRGAVPADALLDCGESGSTLRFLLPVACALGVPVRLAQAGRLPQRPLSPLYEVLAAHGARLGAPGSNPLAASGPLTGTDFTIDASVSSQFVSGLLFALPLLGGGRVNLTGRVESAAYLDMTAEALTLAGVTVRRDSGGYTVHGDYAMPPRCQVEGDWSNAAFWLCAGAIGARPVTVTGLRCDSSQGDRAVAVLLRCFGARVDESAAGVTAAPGPLRGMVIDAAQIPDLVPVLAVAAAVAEGTTEMIHAGRLRLKESDRLQSTAAMLTALGGQVEERPDGLRICGVPRLSGGTVDACGDHRIAMAAAVAACAASGPVTIRGAEAVNKSYPGFWRDYAQLKEEAPCHPAMEPG